VPCSYFKKRGNCEIRSLLIKVVYLEILVFKKDKLIRVS
jgi:hypothetical protein